MGYYMDIFREDQKAARKRFDEYRAMAAWLDEVTDGLTGFYVSLSDFSGVWTVTVYDGALGDMSDGQVTEARRAFDVPYAERLFNTSIGDFSLFASKEMPGVAKPVEVVIRHIPVRNCTVESYKETIEVTKYRSTCVEG